MHAGGKFTVAETGDKFEMSEIGELDGELFCFGNVGVLSNLGLAKVG